MKDLGESLSKEKAKKASMKLAQNIDGANQVEPNAVNAQRMSSKASMDSALSGVETEEPETAPIPIFTSIHLMILRQFVGINAVLAYGGAIVKKAIPALRSIAPIVLTFETLLGAILSIYLLHKLGRKTILQGGTFILAASMLFITIGFFILAEANTAGTILILMGLAVFMFTFGATLGSTIWLYTAEICEPSYIILATVITWIFASVVIVFFPILKKALPDENPVYLFLFFFIWSTISFVVNQKVVIETKGKTEHQIQSEFKNLKIFGMGTVVSPN